MADHTDGMTVHLAHRDVSFVAVSRAPLAEIERFKQRMGWQFRWVSSSANDFNKDFHVSFDPKIVSTARSYYNYGMTGSRTPKRRASACSTRTTRARSSTPTRPSGAAWK